MADSRVREVERRALAGDRVAMGELLVLEKRAGNPDAPRATRCLERGRCRWSMAQLPLLDALGGNAAIYVCVDCYASDVVVDLRRGAWTPGDPFTVASHESGPRHAAESYERPRKHGTGFTSGIWRTCCGQRIACESAPRELARATADAHAKVPATLMAFARDRGDTASVLDRLHRERDASRSGRRCCLSCARSTTLERACRLGATFHAGVVERARAWEPHGLIDEDRDALGPPFEPERWAWIMRHQEHLRARHTLGGLDA